MGRKKKSKEGLKGKFVIHSATGALGLAYFSKTAGMFVKYNLVEDIESCLYDSVDEATNEFAAFELTGGNYEGSVLIEDASHHFQKVFKFNVNEKGVPVLLSGWVFLKAPTAENDVKESGVFEKRTDAIRAMRKQLSASIKSMKNAIKVQKKAALVFNRDMMKGIAQTRKIQNRFDKTW